MYNNPMTTATPEVTQRCEHCGAVLERKPRGGTRKRFCDGQCRLEAWMRRKVLSDLAREHTPTT